MAKKPGKYDHLIGDLKASLGTDPDHQEILNGVRKAILEFVPDPFVPEPTLDSIEDLLLDVGAELDVINRAMRNALNGDHTAQKYTEVYAMLRKIDKLITAKGKVTALILEAMEQLMAAQFDAEKVTMRYLPDGSSVRCGKEPHAVVVDKVANRLWAIKMDLEDSLTLPWQTVNAMAKKALLEGEPEPDGVEIESWPTVTYTEKK